MTIGQNIKNLRREQDITQEQLAEFLCVSPQAVSQWETDRTAPDISQLPVLANVFGVSVDRILGIDLTKTNEKIRAIIDESNEFYRQGNFAGAAEVLKNGLREFPRSFELMERLADNLTCLGERQEAARLCEKILAECRDSEIRESAAQSLIFSRVGSGERNEALGLIATLPHVWSSREDIFLLMSGDGERECILEAIPEYSEFLANRLMMCLQKLAGPQIGYPEDDRVKLLKQSAAVGEAIFSDGDAMFSAQFLRNAYRDLGEIYAKRKAAESLLDCLEKEAKYAEEFETYDPAAAHTSPAVRGYTPGAAMPDDEPETKRIHVRLTESDEYDFVRDSERFKRIMRSLEGRNEGEKQ